MVVEVIETGSTWMWCLPLLQNLPKVSTLREVSTFLNPSHPSSPNALVGDPPSNLPPGFPIQTFGNDRIGLYLII